MGGNGSSPCAACKLLRRRCAKDCIFAPYFPSSDPHKFAIVHKIFGASNVGKMLQELPEQQREDAVNSLVYEASARMKDPVYGCVGAISFLQDQVSHLQMQLAVAQAEILCIQMQQDQPVPTPQIEHFASTHRHQDHQQNSLFYHSRNNHLPQQQQHLNFASSSSDDHSIQDPFKRESFYGHHDLFS
ncbi:hypothetical protein Nepgr_017260 [Nepenthes gracilis]|uniref:LOB domain-containing protein n=1 Tax=Nepenthes gracilis TaxID=150966 RepID=A0AAD3XSX8_NEPGR|nr:hypothetical protein Nepgr_017260 [Nepenthes gracilis]